MVSSLQTLFCTRWPRILLGTILSKHCQITCYLQWSTFIHPMYHPSLTVYIQLTKCTEARSPIHQTLSVEVGRLHTQTAKNQGTQWGRHMDFSILYGCNKMLNSEVWVIRKEGRISSSYLWVMDKIMKKIEKLIWTKIIKDGLKKKRREIWPESLAGWISMETEREYLKGKEETFLLGQECWSKQARWGEEGREKPRIREEQKINSILKSFRARDSSYWCP